VRKTIFIGVLSICTFILFLAGADFLSAQNTVSDKINFDRTGKLAPVPFSHTDHVKRSKCTECHEGNKPLFLKSKSDKAYAMSDMYAGLICGACHDGKKAFEAKKSCAKCHIKKE